MSTRTIEKSVTIALPGTDLVLDGLFLPGDDDRGAVVAPPHPLYGGNMDNPVVSELAWACQKTGIANLRFNWRGVGASAGKASGDLDDGAADYGAALAQMAENVDGPLVACGYSFGAAAAVRAALREPRVARLLLVAPPPALIDAAVGDFAGEILMLAGEWDQIAPPADVATLAAECRRARCDTIPEADHFFAAGLAHIGAAAGEWLAAG